MKRKIKIKQKALALETIQQNQIPNKVKGPVVLPNELDGANSAASGLVIKHPQATTTNFVDVSCNCHGLTFATRRVVIHKRRAVQTILRDDDYRQIKVENSRPGDIIIYYEDSLIEHSGVIISTQSSKYNPKVMSKWGEIGPEMIHDAQDSPYGVDFKVFRKAPLC